MSIEEIRVPDMGDFKDIEVIEVAVKPGDQVAREQTLIVLESDKASMDVPSPHEGRIVSVEIAAGQRISKGGLIARIEVADAAAASAAMLTPEVQATASGQDCDVLVIGGGPGGYSAAFRAADLGRRVMLAERSTVLGGVCLNVGCIPSKALLHVAAVTEQAAQLGDHGIRFPAPEIDLEKLRSYKDGVVGRLTGGLAGMAKMRGIEVVQGSAGFESPHSARVSLTAGGTRAISFSHAIIAAGSEPVHLPFLPADPRIVDSTGALVLPFIPRRMLVIGGGIIGLEMATVYSALGARIDLVEQLDTLFPEVDHEIAQIWRKRNAHRFDRIMLGAKVDSATAETDGIQVMIAGHEPRRYDLVLQSVGRRPSGDALGLGAAGIARDQRGFITVDEQMRSSAPHIFAVGDITGNPMLAHKAVHQAHVAAEVVAGGKSAMVTTLVPSVAYTDPEVAWAGESEQGAAAKGRKVTIGRFPWAASGRAIANGADYGMTKLVFDGETGRLAGGAIIGPSAGDMIGEICLAIEMGADASDIGKTIHPHPTLGESIGMAAEAAKGVCTDLPPVRKSPP